MNRNSAISKKINLDDIIEGLGMRITGVNPRDIAHMQREARRNAMEANLYTALRGNKSKTYYAPSGMPEYWQRSNRQDVKEYRTRDKRQQLANDLDPREFASSTGYFHNRNSMANNVYEQAKMRNRNTGKKVLRYAIPLGLSGLTAMIVGDAIGSNSVPIAKDVKNKLTGLYDTVSQNVKSKNNKATDFVNSGINNLKNSYNLYGNKTRNAYDAFVNTVDDNGKPRVQKSISKRGAINKKINLDDIIEGLGRGITGLDPRNVRALQNQSNDAFFNSLHAEAKLGNSSFDYKAPRTAAERKAYDEREQRQGMAQDARDSYEEMRRNVGRTRRGESLRYIGTKTDTPKGIVRENYLPDFYPPYQDSNLIQNVREKNRRAGKRAIAAAIIGGSLIPISAAIGFQEGKNRAARNNQSGPIQAAKYYYNRMPAK